ATVIYGPGRVRYPRCAKNLHGWSWEYRRKQRRIVRNRVAVITHKGGKEAAPWTREDEARELATRDTEFRRRALIRELAEPVTERSNPEKYLPETGAACGMLQIGPDRREQKKDNSSERYVPDERTEQGNAKCVERKVDQPG